MMSLSTPTGRTLIVLAAIASLFGGLLIRGLWLASAGAPTHSGSSQPGKAPTFMRADILDRDGELLVRSHMAPYLAANPSLIWDAKGATERLMSVFPDLDRGTIEARLSRSSKEFVWIKRRALSDAELQAVLDLELEGMLFPEEPTRFYPNGTLAGHLLGYVGTEKAGMAGLEYVLDSTLKADPTPVRLTIDAAVQFELEAELERAGEDFQLIGAGGIVLEAETGAVRALASWPALDPAHPPSLTAPEAQDRVVGSVYDLGSVFKPLTVAAALEAGVVRETDRYAFDEPIIIQNFEVKDIHPIPGRISLTDVISKSSNKGTVAIARSLGGNAQISMFRKAGLFDRSPIELTLSQAPLLPPEWSELALATSSYGHGMAVTPIAFATAFSAFANNGEFVAPTLLEDKVGEAEALRLFEPDTVRRMNAMLRETVVNGTGKQANISGYRIAGKTGTAEKPINGVYDPDKNITSFAALFPAERPEYVVLIVLDEPKDDTAGGVTAAWNAAPVAGRVIERIAPHLGVMPILETASGLPGSASMSDADRSALQ